jgi:glycosyltransferase involved in cell wall biosynthesis
MELNFQHANYEIGLVSVIIPTFNRGNLLIEAINSVFDQNYRPIECIVVDDGSTDDTMKLLKQLDFTNSVNFCLRIIQQSNGGSQLARNNGILESKGEFIQFLDSDDLLECNKLKNQVMYLNVNLEIDGVYGDWSKGTIRNNKFIKAVWNDDLIFEFLTGRSVVNFSFLMRRSLVLGIGLWDVKVKRNQEIDYHLRGLILGYRYSYLSGNTGLWREHDGPRIFNVSKCEDVVNFYNKWEFILRSRNAWNSELQNGIINNYIWFLNAYKTLNNQQLKVILKEIQFLNPEYPIFTTKVFKTVSCFFGFNLALHLWLCNYKRKK